MPPRLGSWGNRLIWKSMEERSVGNRLAGEGLREDVWLKYIV